jgi:hypothetical protein
MRALSILLLAAAAVPAAGAEIVVHNGGKLIVKSQLTTAGAGTVVESGGELQLDGVIEGAVEVADGGLLDIGGAAAASVQLNGTLALNGTLHMQIGNSGEIATQDRLTGITTLTLGGTLDLSLTGDPVDACQSFDLWEAANTTGGSPQVTGDSLPDGLFYHTCYLTSTGVIHISRAPETYSQWAGYYGAGTETSDVNGDGTCNLLEFALGISPETGGNSLPAYEVESDLSGNRLVLVVRLPVPAPEATIYIVEGSDTLDATDWETLAQRTGNSAWTGTATIVTSAEADGLQTHRISDVVAGTGKRFMRLRVQ